MKSDHQVRGVLLPLQQTQLLLPNVTVSEVIGYRESETIENAPDWLVGSITWRRTKVPVIAFEYFLIDGVEAPGYRARIALCHNLSDQPKMPFIGIICRSIPRLARVNDETVREDELEEALPKMTLKHLYYSDEEAWVPDVQTLAKVSSSYLFK